MKTITFLKSAFFAVCLMGFFPSMYAQEIPSPGGLSWTILDMESPATTPGGGMYELYAWDGENYSVVANPFKDIFNNSDNCIKWDRNGGSWGGVVISAESGGYFNLSRWESVSFKVMAEGYDFITVKVGLQNANGNEVLGKELYSEWDMMDVIPADEWGIITVNFADMDEGNGDGNPTKLLLFLNPGSSDNMTIYVDDIQFLRSTDLGSSGESNIKNMNVAKINVFSNHSAETIQIDGIRGTAKIYNMQGMEIASFDNYNGDAISVSNWASGVYFVRAEGETVKFIVK